MKRLSTKQWMGLGLLVILTLFLLRGPIETALMKMEYVEGGKASIDFIDDAGQRIRMDAPAERIISLYSAHTENLYSLGAGHKIVGIGTADAYPMDVFTKTRYDYRSDPEKVLSANPDVVLIRPFVERNNPDFVNMLRRAGITVVSLYPDSFSGFRDYYEKLGMVVGKQAKATQLMDAFDLYLEEVRQETNHIEEREGVYFESSDRGYLTVTAESIPAMMIKTAGGNLLAQDAVAVEDGSSIAAFGIENILTIADDIDVYVTQRGVMGAGGNTHSIQIRPGFSAIEAIKNERIIEVSQKIISSPTLRLYKGVNEMLRAIYPEVYDNYHNYKSDDLASRSMVASMVINYKHKGLFIPTSSYFKSDRKGHTFGAYEDVEVTHENFDFIESVVAYGYMKGDADLEGEWFYPDQIVTNEMMISILYRLEDVPMGNMAFETLAFDDASTKLKYEKLASNGIMKLESIEELSNELSVNDIIALLDKLGEYRD